MGNSCDCGSPSRARGAAAHQRTKIDLPDGFVLSQFGGSPVVLHDVTRSKQSPGQQAYNRLKKAAADPGDVTNATPSPAAGATTARPHDSDSDMSDSGSSSAGDSAMNSPLFFDDEASSVVSLETPRTTLNKLNAGTPTTASTRASILTSSLPATATTTAAAAAIAVVGVATITAGGNNNGNNDGDEDSKDGGQDDAVADAGGNDDIVIDAEHESDEATAGDEATQDLASVETITEDI